MNEKVREAVDFYTGADYLVVNALLWRNREALDRCMEIAWQNNRGVLEEALEATPEVRFGLPKAEAQARLEAYRRRAPGHLDRAARASILATAVADIRAICAAMRPAGIETCLYRNVDARFALKNVRAGETVELLGITSTSTTGQKIDYGKDDFRDANWQYRIWACAKTPMLALENDYREENEVLLPPMRYRILEATEREGQHVIALEALEALDVEALIAAGLSSATLDL